MVIIVIIVIMFHIVSSFLQRLSTSEILHPNPTIPDRPHLGEVVAELLQGHRLTAATTARSHSDQAALVLLLKLLAWGTPGMF